MYDVGPSAADDLGLGWVRFRPAVVIRPLRVLSNLPPPPKVGPPANLAGANCLGGGGIGRVFILGFVPHVVQTSRSGTLPDEQK